MLAQEVAMLREERFEREGVTLNVALGGNTGPVVLLLHGFMDRWQYFHPILPALVERFRVVAPDMRGHGRSGRAPDGVYRHDDLVADAVAVLDRYAGGGPVALIGHSAGVPVATAVAAQRPAAVSGVVLGDLPLDIPFLTALVASEASMAAHRVLRALAGRPVEEIVAALAEIDPEREARHLEVVAQGLHYLDPRGVDIHAGGRLGDLFGDFDGDAALRSVSCPVLLVRGDPAFGAVMSEEWMNHALTLLARGRGAILPGIGHDLGLPVGDTDALLEVILAFLASL
jgi:pimeloyl-ACP methyl ester carboxylesterase